MRARVDVMRERSPERKQRDRGEHCCGAQGFTSQ
jgi:hypothetical protein